MFFYPSNGQFQALFKTAPVVASVRDPGESVIADESHHFTFFWTDSGIVADNPGFQCWSSE